jgi:RHS repeat-associated protein
MSNPLVAQPQDSTKSYSGVMLLESANDLRSAIQSGDWASVALGAVGTALDALSAAMDPFGAILAAGVGWLLEHVGPLKEALNALTGNADEIAAHSQTWKNVATELGSIGQDLTSTVTADTQSWTGPAGDAYRQRGADIAALIDSAAQGCDGASSGVKTAGEVVGAVRTLVRDTIAELVGHLISWALQVLFTLGIGMLWVVPQVISAVAKTAAHIADITKRLVAALKALIPLLKKAGGLFSDAAKALRGLKPGKATPGPKVDGITGSSAKIPDLHGSTTPSGATPSPHSNGGGSTTPSGATPSPHSDPPPAGGHGSPSPKDNGATTPSGGADRGGSIKDNNKNPEQNSTPNQCRPGSGDPIDMTTGRMMLTESDVEIPGALPLVLSRTHLSPYRAGFRFGRTWASTMDQRLEVDGETIGFAAEDGTLLVYPLPGDESVLPVAGPYWPLTRAPEGGYVIEQADFGRMLYFAPDGAGRLPITAMFDNDGHRLHFCHDSAGNLTEIRHSGGTRIEVETSAGLVTALTLLGQDDADRTLLVRYRYGRDSRLTEVINSSGLPMRYSYDERGRVVRWEDRNGRAYEFAYDELDRCVRGSGSEGHLAYSFTYDFDAHVSTATDSLGHTTAYHMNADFQLVKQIDALGGTSLWEWDRFDRMTSYTDPLGRTQRYEYDERGDLVCETRADGTQRLMTYDDSHRVVSTVEPDGAVWRHEYDADGRLSAHTGPLGATTRYRYDENGALQQFVDEEGNRTSIESDGFARPLVATNALGAETRYSYDALGRLAAETDAAGGTTRFGWTIEGGGWYRTGPDGSSQRRGHDGEGNIIEEVDELGAVTRTDFGPFDLPVTEIAADGSRIRREYDTELRLIAMTNAEGMVWTFEYDALGRKVRERDFAGRVLSYRYDAAGQLVERTNAAGETTTYAYDRMGNVVEKRSGTSVSRFGYDAAGRIARAVNEDADVTFTYDELGRIVAETCNGRTVTSRHDRAGRRVFRATPSGAESVWDYNAIGAPTRLRAGRREISFGYDATARETSRHFGAVSLTQVWDARHRLRAQTVSADNAGVAQHRAFHVRADGAISGVEDLLGGHRDYTLDRAGRVTEVRAGGANERYSYTRSGAVVTVEDPASRRQDAQGRLTWREGWSYTWNSDDRLTEVVTPDGQHWRYRYDALGRRVAKQRVNGNAVVGETLFVWDGDTLVEQLSPDATGQFRTTTWDWNPGNAHPVGQTDRAFTADGRCVDERFYAIVTDFVGTPTELVDDSGKVVWYRRESLWGVPQAAPTGPSTPLRFPGQYLDSETGLHYNFHRYYDPRTARYLSADPLGLDGDLDSHAYVPNPLGWSDPFGLKGGCQNDDGLVPDKGGKGATSPEGLHYDLQSRYPNRGTGAGANRQEKSRLDHILLHSDNDNPNPANGGRAKAEHGVWGTQGGNVWDTKKIVKNIDQGWAKVKAKDPSVQVAVQDGGRTVYTVPMGKQLGYNKDGDGLTGMQIIVEGKNNIITAYPV